MTDSISVIRAESEGAISLDKITGAVDPDHDNNLETGVEVDEMLVGRINMLETLTHDDKLNEILHSDEDNRQELRVLEFWTCLAVCNTVVMSQENLEDIERKREKEKASNEREKAKSKGKGKKALKYVRNTFSTAGKAKEENKNDEILSLADLELMSSNRLSTAGSVRTNNVDSIDGQSGAATPTKSCYKFQRKNKKTAILKSFYQLFVHTRRRPHFRRNP